MLQVRKSSSCRIFPILLQCCFTTETQVLMAISNFFFLGIISWQGASLGGGFAFQLEGGFIFKWGISFDGRQVEKNDKISMGGGAWVPNGIDWWVDNQFGQNCQKLHENYKVTIFGSKQWGDEMGGGKQIFQTVGGFPQSPPTRGDPDALPPPLTKTLQRVWWTTIRQ